MRDLEPLFDHVNGLLKQRQPVLVGVAGPVAVGKSTVAEAIAGKIGADVVSTDSFLYPNAELQNRGLAMRKGYPESYNHTRMQEALRSFRDGKPSDIGVYSHSTYDLVPDRTRRIEPGRALVIEGVVALQAGVKGYLDLAIYIEAPEKTVRSWFVERFLRLVEAGREDETSFYHGLGPLPRDQVIVLAEATWDGINAVNLREYIAPTKAGADLVVEKGPGHEIVALRWKDG